MLKASLPDTNGKYGKSSGNEPIKSQRADGKIELLESDCYDTLGFCYPTWKKWMILSVIFAVQVSMNFNASVYASVVDGLSSAFGISGQAARVGQMIFLVAYAFGSELWAPWSEEFGRWPVLQLSLLLVNIWQIPCALAPNYGTWHHRCLSFSRRPFLCWRFRHTGNGGRYVGTR